jgi:hypothetical protein
MYVGGNPVGNIDPTGHFLLEIAATVMLLTALAWTYGMIRCGHPVYGNYTGDGACSGTISTERNEAFTRELYGKAPDDSPTTRLLKKIQVANFVYHYYILPKRPLTQLDAISQWHDAEGPHPFRDYQENEEYMRRSHALWRPANASGEYKLGSHLRAGFRLRFPSPQPTGRMRHNTYNREYQAIPKGSPLRKERAKINTVGTLTYDYAATLASTALFTFTNFVNSLDGVKRKGPIDPYRDGIYLFEHRNDPDPLKSWASERIEEEKQKWVENEWRKILDNLNIKYMPFWAIQYFLF